MSSSTSSSRPKREKGKSVLTLPTDYTVIDIETTGLDPTHDNIIEIACIKYRSGNEFDEFYSLVQPPVARYGGMYVNSFIASFTGITNQMLENAPKFDEISSSLWDFLNGELLVGHNVNFDINFLYDAFQQENGKLLQNDFLDTMHLARRCLPDLDHHRLTDLVVYFDIGGEHHRAETDCEITNAVLLRLSKLVKDNNINLAAIGGHALRTIQGDPSKFLQDHPFYDKHCVFTGKLEHYSRERAAMLVADIGGHCDNGVTKKTNFLIVGNFDYAASVQDGKSTKVKKAEQLILNGHDLQIISENVFYDLLRDIWPPSTGGV